VTTAWDQSPARAIAELESAADERVRLRAQLAESEARYRAVVATLEEGITLLDGQGRILAANPSAARILGASVAELLGSSLVSPQWEYLDPRGQPLPPDRHPVSLALATGEASTRTLIGLHDRAGELLWLQMTVTPVMGFPMGALPPNPRADGSAGAAAGASPEVAARAVCVFADITFARHEEEERARNELNFRTLIERTPDAMAVLQADTIAYVNPKVVSLLGYEEVEEMLGLPSAEFVHPDDRAMLDRLMQASAARGTSTPAAEERLLRRDGRPVPVEVTTIPIFYDGAPAMLLHARDLSERKRLEAQVVMADRLASVGRLAAAVGHEINNPLAYVMANLDLALEGLGEMGGAHSLTGDDVARLADIAEMLRESREGAERVRHIVRDLRVFSRGETEERTRVDPRHVLDSCVNMARGEIRQRASLVKDYGETPPVLANEARLGQVLLNLLINAAHAIPEGDPEGNEIRVTTSTDDRGRVVIEVRDSGTGIPEEVRGRVFEPFFTTKPPGSGTGLGLPICQSIVTALGGQITFDSEVGRGTAFRVILPAATTGSVPPPRG
jgi:PAS domain S-box-containing protein